MHSHTDCNGLYQGSPGSLGQSTLIPPSEHASVDTLIVDALVQLLKTFNHNDSRRRKLIGLLTTEIAFSDVATRLDIAESTARRAQLDVTERGIDNIDPYVETHQRVSEAQHQDAVYYWNQAMPVESGRNFHTQSGTIDDIYDGYQLWCFEHDTVPVSKHYILDRGMYECNEQHAVYI